MMLRPFESEWRTDLPKLRCALLALSLTAMHRCTMHDAAYDVFATHLDCWTHIAIVHHLMGTNE